MMRLAILQAEVADTCILDFLAGQEAISWN